MANGAIFYEGPSRIDGTPIVGIVTWNTTNRKTGDMAQTWILRQDTHPIEAINTGEDESICGACPLRGIIQGTNKVRTCYVNVAHGPGGVWKAYKAGSYPVLTARHIGKLMGLGLRYGSYGDPVAIPMRFWKRLAVMCHGKSAGYTHQWKNRRYSAWSKLIMASTHSEEENALAHSMGWRTFRTVASEDHRTKLEIHCPASPAGGMTADCASCGACNGRRDTGDGRRSVCIVSHGQRAHTLNSFLTGDVK
jgi:hypothetical protein